MRTKADTEMNWQPSNKMNWCVVCQHFHPHYYKCKKEKIMSDFEAWMEQHKDKFSTYSAEEIMDIAKACGFTSPELDTWYTKSKFNRRVAS